MYKSRSHHLIIRIAVFLSAMLLLTDINHVRAQATQTTQTIPVTSYLDTSSAGWAYKKSDYAFVAEVGECRIQWNAVEMKEPGEKKHLSVRRCCLIPFSEQIPFHRAILKEIFSKWPATEFDNISWGSFGQKSDWSWSLPIAIASSKSREFKNYRENYPKGNVNINRLFVRLANETNSYDAVRQLLLEFGADIELSNVEKVFVLPARELPFYPVLKEQGINPKTRVIYDVAFSYFKIKKP